MNRLLKEIHFYNRHVAAEVLKKLEHVFLIDYIDDWEKPGFL